MNEELDDDKVIPVNNGILCYLPKVSEFTAGGIRKSNKEVEEERYKISDKTLTVAIGYHELNNYEIAKGDIVILKEHAMPELVKNELFVKHGLEKEMVYVNYTEIALIIRQ